MVAHLHSLTTPPAAEPAAPTLGASAGGEPTTWVTVREASEAMGVSRRHLYRLVESGELRAQGEGKKRRIALESLPEAAQRQHRAEAGPAQTLTADELPAGVPRELAYAEAGRRWELLQRWAELTTAQRSGAPGTAIRRAWAECPAGLVEHAQSLAQEPHPGSLDRVLRSVRSRFGAGRNGALYTLGRLSPRDCDRELTLPEDAQSYCRSLWLEKRASTRRMVWRTYLHEAKRRGWPEVSYDTIRRIIDAIPGDLEVLARRGLREARGKAGAFIQRDFSDLAAGEEWVGDHHEFDFFVRAEDGRLFRPWLTGWLDHRSRALAGWVVVEAPNSRTIMQAFAHGARPKHRPEYRQMCGVPARVYVDNGKDYRSHAVEGAGQAYQAGISGEDLQLLGGLCPSLSVEVRHAQPYNAKAKIIERFFCTVASDFSPRLPGYCGHDNKDRTDYLAADVRRHKAWLAGQRRETPFLTMGQARDLFESWAWEYHQRAHDSLSDGGRELSPLDVWRLYGREPVMVRDTSLEFLLMESLQRTVQKNGVEVRGHWYRSDELVGRVGERVEVRLDPVEAGRVYVFTAAGRHICEATAAPLLRGRATPEQIAEANREQKRFERRRRDALKALNEQAPAGALDLVEVLRESPAPLPTPVQPEQATRRMLPRLDRVELRTVEAPPPVSQPITVSAESPARKPQHALRLFASDVEWEEELDDAAESGRGGPR